MNRQKQTYAQQNPNNIIDESEKEAQTNQLDFNDDEPPTRAGESVPEDDILRAESRTRVREAGLTGGATPGDDRTADDLTPDNLVNEDGARSPAEAGGASGAADERLSRKRENQIGAGDGLDEAELARAHPLDGEPWDGEAD